jgi:hypothetical protein
MKHKVIMQEMEMAMAMAAAAVHNLVPRDPATTLEPGVSCRGANAGGHRGDIASGHVADLHLIAVLGWCVLIASFGWSFLSVSNFAGF